MNKEKLITHWEEVICGHIKEYKPYLLDKKLDRMINLFTPGEFYYYVVNFHNLQMEVAHPNTKKLLGIHHDQFTTDKFLELFDEDELQKFKEKETFVADFLFNYLSPDELTFYKVCYLLNVTSKDNVKRTLLHQATTLSVSENGKVEHVLGIHTEVSHLDFGDKDSVSFVHLNGGKSYHNCDYRSGIFSDKLRSNDIVIRKVLTSKEMKVIGFIANGLNSEEIGDKLNNSKHTIDTFRRKIIKKLSCNNMNEVIQRCYIEGVLNS